MKGVCNGLGITWAYGGNLGTYLLPNLLRAYCYYPMSTQCLPNHYLNSTQFVPNSYVFKP